MAYRDPAWGPFIDAEVVEARAFHRRVLRQLPGWLIQVLAPRSAPDANEDAGMLEVLVRRRIDTLLRENDGTKAWIASQGDTEALDSLRSWATTGAGVTRGDDAALGHEAIGEWVQGATRLAEKTAGDEDDLKGNKTLMAELIWLLALADVLAGDGYTDSRLRVRWTRA